MRRLLAPALLVAALAMTGASCASSDNVSAGGDTGTTTPKSGGTTKSTFPAGSGPKCQAVKTMLQVQLQVKGDASKRPAADVLAKNIDTAREKLVKNIESHTADADAMSAYLKKLAAGQTPTDAEKKAAEDAVKWLTFYNNQNCKEKATKASPTTTAKK